MQIGNAWIDDNTGQVGMYDYFWTHALNSDETNAGIHKYCNLVTDNFPSQCDDYQTRGDLETGNIDIYNIYAPICKNAKPKSGQSGSVSLYALIKIVFIYLFIYFFMNNFNLIRIIKK